MLGLFLGSSHLAWVVCGLVLVGLLFVPTVRHWLYGLLLACGGWCDARILAKRPEVAAEVGQRRVEVLVSRGEATFAKWLQRRRSWFAGMLARYKRSFQAWRAAEAGLSDAEAAATAAEPERDTPQLLSLAPWPYRAVLTVCGCGEGILTYLAFQLWHLQPLGLLVIVGLLALGGAWIGHGFGQAIYREQRRYMWGLGAVAILYCALLGGMRFAWLASHGDKGGASLINFASAVGWPVFWLAIATFAGTQMRYVSAVEAARASELRTRAQCDRIDCSARSEVHALNDGMTVHKNLRDNLAEAYQRGFCFGWRGEGVRPDLSVRRTVIPVDDLKALWEPAVDVSPNAPHLVPVLVEASR